MKNEAGFVSRTKPASLFSGCGVFRIGLLFRPINQACERDVVDCHDTLERLALRDLAAHRDQVAAVELLQIGLLRQEHDPPVVLVHGFGRGVVKDEIAVLDLELAGDPLEFLVAADFIGELGQDRALAVLRRGRLAWTPAGFPWGRGSTSLAIGSAGVVAMLLGFGIRRGKSVSGGGGTTGAELSGGAGVSRITAPRDGGFGCCESSRLNQP